MAAPVTVKLRCKSWAQLRAIYERDLARSALFLKASSPPPLGTEIRVDLTLPSESLVVLRGTVHEHIPKGGLGGRGPGVDLALEQIPQSAMWLIEQALTAAQQQGTEPRPLPRESLVQAEKKLTRPTGRPMAATDPTVNQTGDPTAEPAIETDAEIAAAEASLVSALKQEYESLRKLNPFQILGVGYEATDEAVRAAFGEYTRRYHPDRFARYQSKEARTYASEIFILIRDAYRKLGTAKARTRTVEAIRQRSTPTRGTRHSTARPQPRSVPVPIVNEKKSSPIVSGPPQGPAFTPRPAGTPPAGTPTRPPTDPAADPAAAPRARTATPAQGVPQPPSTGTLSAEEMFGSTGTQEGAGPIQLDSDRKNPAAERHKEANALLDAGNYDEGLQVFRVAARKDPGDRIARAGVELAEGLKALAQRDRLEAAQRFESVIELDPDNERAARELAEMRRVATNERKGLLGRLLGRKV